MQIAVVIGVRSLKKFPDFAEKPDVSWCDLEVSMYMLIWKVAGFVALGLLIGAPAQAGFITWRINEIYSNPDGTIQYVEFLESNGQDAQGSFRGKLMKTFIAGAPANDALAIHQFLDDLPSRTADQYALVATAGFESVQGGIIPDFIMPDGFIDLDVVTKITLSTIDTVEFDVGDIPEDGRLAYFPAGPSTGANSPTNFAGDVGHIDLPEPGAALACAIGIATLGLLRRVTPRA
jgi:hypothetical protein